MKKGQQALEYLTTYGWALLIIAIVIIALWAMGVFKLSAPSGATGFQAFRVIGFQVEYWTATDSNFSAQFGNLTGQRLTNVSVDVSDGTNTTTVTSGNTLPPGGTLTVTDANLGYVVCTSAASGEQYSLDITIKYKIGAYNYADKGTISGACA